MTMMSFIVMKTLPPFPILSLREIEKFGGIISLSFTPESSFDSTAMKMSGSSEPSMCSSAAFFPLTPLQFATTTVISSHWVLRNRRSCRGRLSTGVGARTVAATWSVMGVDVADGAVWSGSTGDGRSDGVFRGDGGMPVTSKLVSVMVRESWVLDDILEWLNSPELMFQNCGIPHSSHAQVRDSDSTWVWYNDSGMPRHCAWYHPRHSLHWRQFWVHFAAFLQILQGNFGNLGPGFSFTSPAWMIRSSVRHDVILPCRKVIGYGNEFRRGR